MPTARELNELHCDIQLQRIRERREDREREEAARKEERISPAARVAFIRVKALRELYKTSRMITTREQRRILAALTEQDLTHVAIALEIWEAKASAPVPAPQLDSVLELSTANVGSNVNANVNATDEVPR